MPLCPNTTLLLPDRYYTVVANTAARPTGAALLTGMMIYQTDVGRTYLWDGSGWVIMSEPVQSFGPTVTSFSGTITTLGTVTFTYHRSDGWLDFNLVIPITTNGTAGTTIRATLPVAPAIPTGAASVVVAYGRETSVTGKSFIGTYQATAAVLELNNYDNSYVGGSGYTLHTAGRYRMTTRYS